MRRMMNGEGCLQIPKEFLTVAGLNREAEVLIGMAPEMILITSKNLDETKREKIRDALRNFSADLDIPLIPEGVLLPEEMLMDAGLPCDPELLDMYLEDGRIVIELLEELEEELLEEINALGIGPQGLGGRTTALAVHIEVAAVHMASLPVAVNINCHVTRHESEVL